MIDCSNAPQSDIVISIIFTESAADLLDICYVPIEKLAQRQKSQYILKPSKSTSSSVTSGNLSDKFANCFRSHVEHNIFEPDIPYLFTTNFRTDSEESLLDISIENDTEANIKSSTHVIATRKLLPLKVFLRQLMAARSSAHRGCLQCVGQNLHVSVFDSKTSVSESVWSNVCRICHGGASVGDLLEPCNCKGSIAFVHLKCLERWLLESAYNQCELCLHQYKIIREPKYSIPCSIFIFLRHPGSHFRDLLYDGLAFLIYTPSAIISTYMLMLICESVTKSNMEDTSFPSHVIAFSAIFGMAAIDFTYSSWLIMCLQRHTDAWRLWYRNTCQLRLVLPEHTRRRRRYIDRIAPAEDEVD